MFRSFRGSLDII